MDDDEQVEMTNGRGTMVIRVWSEAGSIEPFRARLTYSRAATEPPQVTVVTSHDQLLDTVRNWLEDSSG